MNEQDDCNNLLQEISGLLKMCGENYCTAPVYGAGVELAPVRGTPDCLTLGGLTSVCKEHQVWVWRGNAGDAGKQMAAPSFRQHNLVQ